MLVAMKKLTLYALKDDRDAILLALQKNGNVMLLQEGDKKPLAGAETISSEKEKAAEVLKFLAQHGVKNSLLAQKAQVPYGQFLTKQPSGEAITTQIDQLANEISTLENEAMGMRAQATTLEPWKSLDIPLEELTATTHTVCFVGYVPSNALENLQKDLEPLLAEVITLEEAPEGRAVVVIAHKEAEAEAKHFLKEHDFSEAILPKQLGTAKDVAATLLQEAEAKEAQAKNLAVQVTALGKDKEQVELYYDQLATAEERMANGGEETLKTFYVEGWVRHDKTDAVEQAVQAVTDAYQLEFLEPAEGEVPPTVLENNSLVKPYESVIELYSMPKAGSIDPDFIMAPFHFIFFGMMLSDAGYGLVLTVLLLIALKMFKPKGFAGNLAMVIFFGSISTVIWGALFGGWFGLEWHPLLFVPMREPLKMLALCFGLGALHLVCGMFVKMYMLVRDGDVVGAICDEASWLMMFTGFFCMAAVPGPLGKYLAMLGAGIIILFGGREKKTIISRLMGGCLSLYNISGYLSDLLSYSRLFALGLATGVIAMVINTIAQMLMAAGPIGMAGALLVVFAGHAFNIVINVLGAFVHSSRLQYIEFFGKFYEAGGRAFLPLALRTKYTDITK